MRSRLLVPAGVFAQAPGRQPRRRRRGPVDQRSRSRSRSSRGPGARCHPTTSSAQTMCWRSCSGRQGQPARDVMVRPDGKITLPLLNDIQAAGLTPDQLRAGDRRRRRRSTSRPERLGDRQGSQQPQGVRHRPGRQARALLAHQPTTVLQMLALAGGLGDFAKKDKIAVMRTENGQTTAAPKFNYKDVHRRARSWSRTSC